MIETIYSNPDILCHYGIKGMKWGVRRYQNKDGTLTNAGRKRYDYGKAGSNLQRVSKSLGSVANSTSRLIRNHTKDKNPGYDFSNLSDQELRNRINRINMERQYADLLKDPKQKTAKERALETLDLVADVATVAGSVGLAASVIYKIKHADTYSDELYHHGIKGMKWGVCRYQNKNGTLTSLGRSKYLNDDGTLNAKGKQKYKTKENYDVVRRQEITRNVLLGAAAVTVAVAVGYTAHQYGKQKADKILEAGTLVNNVAPHSREFDTSFYGVTDRKDAQFYLKNFSAQPTLANLEGRLKATVLTNDAPIKIAGRDSMKKAYKSLSYDQKYGRANFNDYWRRFGGLTEEERAPFINELKKQGYGGFKDVNDMSIGWGNTPTVFFGKDSGLKVRNSATIDYAKARKLKVNDCILTTQNKIMIADNVARLGALYSAAVVNRVGVQRNNLAIEQFGTTYNNLSKRQKDIIKYYEKYGY